MKVLVTGASGFIGMNLIAHLNERKDVDILQFGRTDNFNELCARVSQADFIFHLAGVNRPEKLEEFQAGNTDLTRALCKAVVVSGRKIPVLYTSSTQAEYDNSYGVSKLRAEKELAKLSSEHGSAVHLFRLPNVFGKWARPNYNSVVATFCHNIARKLPIQINDPAAEVSLVYIDDVIKHFISVMDGHVVDTSFPEVQPRYQATVGWIAQQLSAFENGRKCMTTEAVADGLLRALYSTYLSYLPPEDFTYEIPKYEDDRGTFVEMLKTRDSGQFSFFTAHPGVTRGGHYHHSKTEKFLVVRGNARFCFRHIVTGEFYELFTKSDKPVIVETVPGWSHDITNVGAEEMIVILWANEVFDRENPDTYSLPVGRKV